MTKSLHAQAAARGRGIAAEPSDPGESRGQLMPVPDTETGAMAITAEAIARRLVGDAAGALMQVGRIQALDFVQRVTDVAMAQAFAELSATKGYRGLPYTDDSGNPATVQTVEQFCALYLGRSYSRCVQLRGNLHLLGSDLYDAAEQVGFRASDYTALKALPADDQEAVRQALGSEDKDRALQVLAELVARQSAEKSAALEAKGQAETAAAEARAQYKAASDLVGEKETELRKMRSDRLKKPATLDESFAAWASFVGQQVAEIRHRLAQIDQVRVSALALDPPPIDTPEREAHMRGLRLVADALSALNQVGDEVLGLSNAFDQTLGMVVYVNEMPQDD